MSTVDASNAIPANWIQTANQNPLAFLTTLDQLLESFGAEDIGNASAQKFLTEFAEGLKEMINNSDLPDGIKQASLAMIDQQLSDLKADCPCSAEAAEALETSEMAEEIDEAVEDSLCACQGGAESESAGAAEAAAGGAEASSDEASAEAAGETANESVAGAGGGAESEAGVSAAQANQDLNELMAETSDPDKKRRKTFLEAIAESMGIVQGKFLEEAKIESDKMVGLAGDDTQAQAFTLAQARYTALMQMFNIYSNQVATSLKTMGEALSGIARKQ